MGLFSKLAKKAEELGLNKVVDAMKDAAAKSENATTNDSEDQGIPIGNLLAAAASAIKKNSSAVDADPQNAAGGQATAGAASYQGIPTPSAASWDGLPYGPVMPSEANQFNSGMPWDQYFEGIFRGEFPGYHVVREDPAGGKRVIFTFLHGESKALVVELLNQSSSSRKLRSDCLKAGIPYLRYYYDHEGWWNTRSYVLERTKKALS